MASASPRVPRMAMGLIMPGELAPTAIPSFVRRCLVVWLQHVTDSVRVVPKQRGCRYSLLRSLGTRIGGDCCFGDQALTVTRPFSSGSSATAADGVASGAEPWTSGSNESPLNGLKLLSRKLELQLVDANFGARANERFGAMRLQSGGQQLLTFFQLADRKKDCDRL